MRRIYILIGIVLMLAAMIVFSNCSAQSFSQTGEEKEKDTAAPVEVIKAEKGDITVSYSGSTTLEAEADAVVVAKIGEVVKEILVEEGDMVREGQILAKLEDEQFKLELAKAESLLKKLSNDYQRNEALYNNKIISKDTFDQVKYDFQTQKSVENLARLNYEYAAIRAPITGVVSERLIKRGNMVQKNQATFRITGFTPLHALLYVPEKELSKLRPGFPAKLYADALPDSEFEGKILRISPVVDAGTGTFKVTVEVHDRTMILKPGMFARIHIVYDTHAATVLVPRNTIIEEDTDTWVFKVQKDTAARTRVETGYKNKTQVEILSGLSIGDTVVSTGLSSLKDGAKVKII